MHTVGYVELKSIISSFNGLIYEKHSTGIVSRGKDVVNFFLKEKLQFYKSVVKSYSGAHMNTERGFSCCSCFIKALRTEVTRTQSTVPLCRL